MIFLLFFIVGFVAGVVLASVRRPSGESAWIEGHRSAELDRRLAKLEQSAEEGGRAMERLEEGQRFLLSALTSRSGSGSRTLAPGEHRAASPPDQEPEDKA